jgi:D-alanyl-D-alanine carboxypeptidase
MLRTVLLLAFSATPLVGQSLPPVADARRVADSLITAYMATNNSPSVAVAVVRGTDTIAFVAKGMADLEMGVAATPAHRYRIGSVTKQFTAAAVLQLAEQGKLGLDDAIGTHLSSLPSAWHAVTVRQLLNHTSGIPSYTEIGAAWFSRWDQELTPDSLVALTADKPMDFAPGTNWKYNNTGYVILGMLIEKHAGRSWGADLQERFAKPLGLGSTMECATAPIIPRRVRGYEPGERGWINTPHLPMSHPYAAGAMCSTIGDLVTWNRALHGGKVLTPSMYVAMTTPSGVAAKPEHRYGFGIGSGPFHGATLIAHGGGINGFITANGVIPEHQLSVTVLTNSGRADPERLMRNLARAAIGAPVEGAATVVPLAAEWRDRYVGVYLLTLGAEQRTFTVARAGDGLTGQMQGQAPIPMLHLGNHDFGVGFDPAIRLTFTVDGPRVTAMSLLQNGRTITGARQ